VRIRGRDGGVCKEEEALAVDARGRKLEADETGWRKWAGAVVVGSSEEDEPSGRGGELTAGATAGGYEKEDGAVDERA
jgi:hypothetical protein